MKLPTIVTTAATPILAIALLATPARASDAPAPAAPVQLVQAGDRAMTCQALAGEINALASAQATPAPAPEKKKKKGGFGLLKALGSAAPLLGQFGGGMGGALASSAMSAVQQGSMTSSVDDAMANANDMARQAMAGPSVAEQRKARLMGIFETRGC